MLAAACSREPAAAQPPIDATPLKSLAPFPIGVAAQALHAADPAWTDLAATHFSQLTAEWEMKMEYIVQPDGGFRFDRGDALANFARSRGMRLFGHTLVWYANEPEAFARLDERRQSFEGALRNYVTAVVGRYRGLASGWDVINEPIKDDGSGPRDSLWSRRLGQVGHFKVAFEAARAADPDAVLFTNDYHLESKPAKLASYQRLIDEVLSAGVPLTGIGCQTHLIADLPAGALTRTLKVLAGFGLPIHLSEMDVSLIHGGLFASRRDSELAQARLYGEAMEAFAALPERQQFAFTVWGLRDRDSWLTRQNAQDAPLLFDDRGQPKAAFAAVVDALRR
ncbi:1,4-beta-xylanase [Caulobacter mirabilis]|uniref:Beta-xylanase n=1 Tax=Caulobacter mirabilis TaxID=69666 RepID=A0A2D2B3S0_9CAUL|nr:1,4-beta-xylanase [Caulobacter mirabilis]